MKQIGFLTIELKQYPVFLNLWDGKTYYSRDNLYIFVDWNWIK